MSKIACATSEELECWRKMAKYTEYWRACCHAELIRREAKRIGSPLQYRSYESIATELMQHREARKKRVSDHNQKRLDRIKPRFRRLV